MEYCRSTSFAKVRPILDSMFAAFGQVNTVKTDNGPPFNGHEFSEYAKKKGFNHHKVTPRHPRANGECERFMRNLNKAIRIAQEENVDYKERITGMLEAYRATPHPATLKSPYELMFGRKMNLSMFPTIQKTMDDADIRSHHSRYKQKAKEYHDKKRNVKKSHVKLGDKVLMKNRRTDRLKPEVGTVIGIMGHTVTVRFGNGSVFKRDKSHFKIINEAVSQSDHCVARKRTKEGNQVPIVDTESESDNTDVEEDDETSHTQRTRSGREVRAPQRFGEWMYH